MIKLLKKILGKKTTSSLLKYKKYFRSDESTFLDNSNFRFDAENKLENRKYVTIGEKGIITANFIFETEKGEIKIGNNVHIGGANFICRNSITVEDDVTMAWGITIYDHNSHSIYWEERKKDNYQCYDDYINFNSNNIANKDWSNVIDSPIVIQSKAWIGFDVTILKGVTIGEGAVIGTKSVVVKNVDPWTVVAGNPAKIIKYLPEYKK